MKIEATNWQALSTAERIRYLEVEGYVVIPDAMTPEQLEAVREEVTRLPMQMNAYHHLQGATIREPQWDSPACGELIANTPVIEYLEHVIGDDIVFISGGYRYYDPGAIGVAFHTDGYPYGSNLGGWLWTCPVIVRVSYYLDDLTEEMGAFRIVPRSHICIHSDANPYLRFDEHPEEVGLLAKAGDAVIFMSQIFHAAAPNISDRQRRVLLYGYRPSWAGPLQPVDEWNPEDLAKAPESAERFLQPLNTKGWQWELQNRPAHMYGREAPGVNPSRWGDGTR